MPSHSAFILLISIVLCSCSKEHKTEFTNAPTPTIEELLINNNWAFSGLSCSPTTDWDGSGNMVSDIFPLLDQCYKDNCLLFNEPRKYCILEGDCSCTSVFPDTAEQGLWWFNTNKDSITKQVLGGNCFKPRHMKITALGYNVLKLSYTEQEQDGMRTYTETYFLK